MNMPFFKTILLPTLLHACIHVCSYMYMYTHMYIYTVNVHKVIKEQKKGTVNSLGAHFSLMWF